MIADIVVAGSMFLAGYQIMQTVKYTVGLILLIANQYEAWAWWHREILGL